MRSSAVKIQICSLREDFFPFMRRQHVLSVIIYSTISAMGITDISVHVCSILSGFKRLLRLALYYDMSFVEMDKTSWSNGSFQICSNLIVCTFSFILGNQKTSK